MSSDDPTPDDFNARIQKYVQDAEAHMDLAPGTISNTGLESDFLFVVKMCAVIEPLLREAVREHVRRVLKFARVMTAESETLLKSIGDLSPAELRKILVEFGAIDATISNFVKALFLVRHRYAHHIANAHLSVKQICEKISAEGGDKHLLNKLTGLDQSKEIGPIVAAFLRPIMFHNVASFLRAAVHLAKPPPALPGGLLGALFNKPAGDFTD
jgi:hypothetical protein